MEIDAAVALPQQPEQVATRPSRLTWLAEGARTLLFLRPRWNRLETGPMLLAALVVLDVAASIGLSRLYFEGEVRFNWRAVLAGWAAFLLTIWACYVLRPQADDTTDEKRAPDAAHLVTMFAAQMLCLTIAYGILYATLTRTGLLADAGLLAQWAAWLLPALWGTPATMVLLLRSGGRALSQRVPAICAICMACTLTYYLSPAPAFWFQQQPESAEEEPLRITQDMVENQAPLLAEKLGQLAPQRPGVADMYTITFAPYEGEEVFRRESRMVAEVMAKRFDAVGRGIQMINHREHLDNMPWASTTNLQRAINGIARTMDRDEDVLFIHLTSHGAQDGELAASFWPLDVDPVMPADLKKWLDAAGIKHRVLSISACYSGSWIAPLANDDTLVMTASDADHTSYGCGKRSELTFFGRAMYDEQIRTQTRDFAAAHAVARKVIDKREKEAGKEDGYSNPQIKMGVNIKPYLDKLRARLGD